MKDSTSAGGTKVNVEGFETQIVKVKTDLGSEVYTTTYNDYTQLA